MKTLETIGAKTNSKGIAINKNGKIIGVDLKFAGIKNNNSQRTKKK